MNTILKDEYPGNHDLRDQMLDILSDDDLAYRLPGNNLTLGALIEEMGRTQQIYTKSFATGEMDWLLEARPPAASGSVAALKMWFEELDAEMVTALEGSRTTTSRPTRSTGVTASPPPRCDQFQIYREALLSSSAPKPASACGRWRSRCLGSGGAGLGSGRRALQVGHAGQPCQLWVAAVTGFKSRPAPLRFPMLCTYPNVRSLRPA